MLDTDYVRVADKSEIPIGKMKKVQLDDNEILIVNLNGKYYAISSRCTHMKGDLSKGSLEGEIVTCPKHGAKFNITTGKMAEKPRVGIFRPKAADLATYEVKTEKEYVLVKKAK